MKFEDFAYLPADTLHNRIWSLIIDLWDMRDALIEDILILENK